MTLGEIQEAAELVWAQLNESEQVKVKSMLDLGQHDELRELMLARFGLRGSNMLWVALEQTRPRDSIACM